MPRHVLFDRELPRGWSLTTVDAIKAPEKSACVAGPFGSNISSKYFAPEGVPVIRGSNLTDDLTRFVPKGFVFVSPERAASYRAQHVRAGDLVFTCWGTIGQVGLIPANGPFPEYIISNKQLKLRPNTALTDSLYLFYYFASPQMVGHVRNRAIGAAVPGINLGILKALEVVLPPIGDQRRIASILSAYDDLIENNTRRIAILEEMARRIYDEWFVRLRFPGHEGVRMVESELGLVPEGWALRAFDEVATFTNGYAFKPEDWGREGVPIVKIKELKAGVQGDTPRFAGSLPARYRIKHGDLLFSWSADLDVYIWGDDEGWLNQHLFLVNALGDATPRSYLFHALKAGMPAFRTRSNGATMKHIKRSALSEVKAVVPSAAVAAAFEQIVGPLHEMVKVLWRKNRNLRTTRDLLLPKLISGELDVSSMPEPEALAA